MEVWYGDMGGWLDMDMDRWKIQNSFRLSEIFKGDFCNCSLPVEIWLYNGVWCWAHLLGDWHSYQGCDDASDNPRCGEHRAQAAQVRCIMICTFYPVLAYLLQSLCKGGEMWTWTTCVNTLLVRNCSWQLSFRRSLLSWTSFHEGGMESFETERNDQTLSAMIYVKRMFLSPHLALCLHRCCFLRPYFMCCTCDRYNICRLC